MKKSCGRLTGCLFLVLLSLGCTGAKKEDTRAQASKETVTPIKVVIKEAVDSQEGYQEGAGGADSETVCQSDHDCAFIPQPPEACVPCLFGSTGKAVNKATSGPIMKPLVERGDCKANFEKASKLQNPQEGRTKDPSCEYWGAKCIEGQCKAAMTLEEWQTKMKAKAQQHGAQGGQMGGAPAAPSAPNHAKLGADGAGRMPMQPSFGSNDSAAQTLPGYPGAAPLGNVSAWGAKDGFQTSPGYPGAAPSLGGNYPIQPRNGASRFDTSNFSSREFAGQWGQGLGTQDQSFRFGGTAGQYEDRRPQGYGSASALPAAYNDMKSFPGFGGR